MPHETREEMILGRTARDLFNFHSEISRIVGRVRAGQMDPETGLAEVKALIESLAPAAPAPPPARETELDACLRSNQALRIENDGLRRTNRELNRQLVELRTGGP